MSRRQPRDVGYTLVYTRRSMRPAAQVHERRFPSMEALTDWLNATSQHDVEVVRIVRD